MKRLICLLAYLRYGKSPVEFSCEFNNRFVGYDMDLYTLEYENGSLNIYFTQHGILKGNPVSYKYSLGTFSKWGIYKPNEDLRESYH